MIQFVTAVRSGTLYMAFNNLVIRYYSSTTSTPLRSEITGLTTEAIILYPGPDGRFFFNFKPYVAALINNHNFEDTVQPALVSGDADSFVYNVANRVFLQRPVTTVL